MLRVVFAQIHEDQVDRLRAWMRELGRRRDEVLATFKQEGTRHEMAYLIEGKTGPVLVYITEVADADQASQAFGASTLPIDLEHQQVVRDVTAGRAEAELLFELARSTR